MSPKIGMTLSLRGWARPTQTPAAKVHVALLRMRATGILVTWGDFGVAYRPLVGGWHRTGALGVNILGAVLLAFQPERDEDATAAHEDPAAAAARELGVPIAYVAGIGDGWDRAAHSIEWLGSVHRAAYLDGYETGMEARFRETTVCSCGTRRARSEPTCPGCDKGSST